MSKGLLIALLAAALSGIAALVWWQSASYSKGEEKLKRELEEEQRQRLKDAPYVPKRTSGLQPDILRRDGQGRMNALLGYP